MYIYKITNVENQKVYIGQTRTSYPIGRWSAHKNKLENGTHKNPHLLAAWNKYGKHSWKFEVIDSAGDVNTLDKLEIQYIQRYDSMDPKKGYNIASGGTNGFTFSEETKRKIGRSSKGRKTSDETKEKQRQAMIGRKMPPKTENQIQKLSNALKSKWTNKEFRAKMVKARKKQMTDELKAKISKAKKIRFAQYGHNQAKQWPSVVSPDGQQYDNIVDMSKFSRNHGLSDSKMRLVCHGIRSHHRGWKLLKTL